MTEATPEYAEPLVLAVNPGAGSTKLALYRGDALVREEKLTHPALMQRPCSVGTLVNEEAQIVGYCTRGKQCRTNDWRPVLDGCEAARAPGMSPAAPGSGLEIAGRR